MGQPPVHHVEPRGRQWALRREGGEQASQLFRTREEAEAKANELALESNGSVVVHDREGNVTKRIDRL